MTARWSEDDSDVDAATLSDDAVTDDKQVVSLPVIRGTRDGADCASCPLAHNGVAERPVFAEGPADPLWIIVGEGPGQNEVAQRRPFVGASGQIVNKALKILGVDRTRLWVTNATLCIPPKDATESDKKAAQRCCAPRLLPEIAKFPGKPILALGAIAAQAFLGTQFSITDLAGSCNDVVVGTPDMRRISELLDTLRATLTKIQEKDKKRAAKLASLQEAHTAKCGDACPVVVGVTVTSAKFGTCTGQRLVNKLAKAVDRTLVYVGRAEADANTALAADDVKAVQKARKQRGRADLAYDKAQAQWQAAVDEHAATCNDNTPCPTTVPVARTKRARCALATRVAAVSDAYYAGLEAANLTQNEIDKYTAEFNQAQIDCNDVSRPIIPTIHPAAILRGGAGVAGTHAPDLGFWYIVYDAAKVNALALGKNIRFDTKSVETEFEDSARAAVLVDKLLDSVTKHGTVAIDTETYVEDAARHHTLQPLNVKIRALGLATPEYGISLYWSIVDEVTRIRIRLLLANSDIRKVFHNAPYDVPVLDNNGLTVVGEWDDTLLAHHAAFPGLAHGLQRVVAQFNAVLPWKTNFRKGKGRAKGKNPDNRPVEEPAALTLYNAFDTIGTARIVAPLTLIVKKTLTEKVYEMDLAMARTANLMHTVGVPVSRDVNADLMALFSANMKEARREIEDKANHPDIRDKLWTRLAMEQALTKRKNDSEEYDQRVLKRISEIEAAFNKGKWEWSIGSSDHLAAYLKARGVPMFEKTDKGKTATSKDILERFVGVPEVQNLITYRENQKLYSTYCWRMFDRYDADNNIVSYGYADEYDRVHPRWSVNKITGRWGAEEPSAMNVPKADKKRGRPNLRAQVVPGDGRIFVGFDFGQLEARIIALMSGDPFLVAIFAEGRDIHSEFARIVWPNFDQLPADERKKLRDMIKRPEYGAFYGGKVETLWANVVKDYPSVKLADIAKMVQLMTAKMPGVTRWHNDLLRGVAKTPHEIRSAIYGRRRCFPLGNADVNEVYNFPAQSTGADIMDTGLHRIMPRLTKYDQCWPILQIHDAAVFECWEDDAEAVQADVIECFTQEHTVNGVTVQFPIEADIGRSWADV